MGIFKIKFLMLGGQRDVESLELVNRTSDGSSSTSGRQPAYKESESSRLLFVGYYRYISVIRPTISVKFYDYTCKKDQRKICQFIMNCRTENYSDDVFKMLDGGQEVIPMRQNILWKLFFSLYTLGSY